MRKLNFYFKTDAKLHIAEDMETGEGTEAYLKVSMDTEKEPTAKELTAFEKVFRAQVAFMLDAEKELIYPISEDEYLKNNENGDEE